MHFTSEHQTPIAFLFVNESIKIGYAFSYLERDEYFGIMLKIRFAFSAPPFTAGEILHVAYKNIKEKKIYFFRYHDLKTSEVSLVLRTRESSDVFNTLDAIYLVFTSKR